MTGAFFPWHILLRVPSFGVRSLVAGGPFECQVIGFGAGTTEVAGRILPGHSWDTSSIGRDDGLRAYIADSAGCRTWRDSNHSKRCYAARRGIASSTNRKNRVLRVPATKQSAVKSTTWRRYFCDLPRATARYAVGRALVCCIGLITLRTPNAFLHFFKLEAPGIA